MKANVAAYQSEIFTSSVSQPLYLKWMNESNLLILHKANCLLSIKKQARQNDYIQSGCLLEEKGEKAIALGS